MNQGGTPSADVVFAVRMLMVRFGLTRADLFKVMVALDKEDKNVAVSKEC